MSQMKKTFNTSRKALESKMAEALNDEIKMLPTEMQEILLDDLVTAFQSRFKVVKEAVTKEATSNFEYYVELGVKIPQ